MCFGEEGGSIDWTSISQKSFIESTPVGLKWWRAAMLVVDAIKHQKVSGKGSWFGEPSPVHPTLFLLVPTDR